LRLFQNRNILLRFLPLSRVLGGEDRNDRKGVSFRTKMRIESEYEEKSYLQIPFYNSPNKRVNNLRIALISDIHGNLVALNAVLRDIKKQEIDEVVCLGDVATLGPHPTQVIAELKKLACLCIMGNHELALLDLNLAGHYRIAPPLVSTLRWCFDKLNNHDIKYLKSFKASLKISFGKDSTLLCYHGSPTSTTDIILAEISNKEVDKTLNNKAATIMAGGHTHIQMLRQRDGRLLINPGSVGAAFAKFYAQGEIPELLPWAEYAILDYDSEILNIGMLRVPFDIVALKSAIKKSDIPIKDWWLGQYNQNSKYFTL
jgi:putative phosphoesterase